MSRRILHFGDCSLDIAARELRRVGERVGVPPRSFDCIAYLIEHRERAVGRDELVSAVWGKASISDTVLGKCVLAARRAVGDSAEAQAFIRTVSRFGYHWVAEVRIETDSAAEPTQGAATESPPLPAEIPRPRRAALSRPAGIAIVLGLAAAALLVVRERAYIDPVKNDRADKVEVVAAPAIGSETRIASIGVLPAEVDAEGDDAWLRLGLMDLIATRLRRAGVATMSSDSVLRLIHATTPIDEAARALQQAGVHSRVGLSVRKAGANWLIRVQLQIDGKATREVEGRGVDALLAARDASDRLLELMGHAPSAAADVLEPSLAELLQRTEAARLSDDLDTARRLIAAAPPSQAQTPQLRLRLAQIDIRAGDFKTAYDHLQALLAVLPAETDPTLRAQALYALATSMVRLDQPESALHAFDEGVTLLEHAGDRDMLARHYMGRGNVKALLGRYDDARSDYAHARAAFELAGDPFMLAWLDGNEGVLLIKRGRPREALPLLARAQQQFEHFGVFNELIGMASNRINAELDLLEPVAALAVSDHVEAYLNHIGDLQTRHLFQSRQARALAANGRNREARALFSQVLQEAASDERDVRGLSQLGLAQLSLDAGDFDAAQTAARAAVDLLAPPTLSDYTSARAQAWLTLVHALRGKRDAEALALETQRFSAWAANMQIPLVGLRASLANAEQLGFAEHLADAEQSYEKALREADAIDVPAVVAEAVSPYANFLLAQGRNEAAAMAIGRLARFADDDFASAVLQARLYRTLGQSDASNASLERAQRLAGERMIADPPVPVSAAHPPY